MPEGNARPGWDDRLRDVGAHVEDDLRRVIAYINDEVVPDVRRNGSAALRAAATELDRLARRIDERPRTGVAGAPPPPKPGEPPQ